MRVFNLEGSKSAKMKKQVQACVVAVAAFVVFVVSVSGQAPKPAAKAEPATPKTAAKGGTISGHVKLMGTAPGNPVIRMGGDPVCASLARSSSKPAVQELALVDANGGVANTYIALQGTFPATPVSTEPVTINQRNCIYLPRVVAGRVGQTLKIVNQDTTVHNLHSMSLKNDFNVTQPKSGMVFTYTLKSPETMVRLKCDVHSWMLGYVAVSSHRYFSMSGADGSFSIANVPPGRYTIKTWHERFGEQTRMVTVTAGGTATMDFAYDAAAKPRSARLFEDLVVPLLASATTVHHAG